MEGTAITSKLDIVLKGNVAYKGLFLELFNITVDYTLSNRSFVTFVLYWEVSLTGTFGVISTINNHQYV